MVEEKRSDRRQSGSIFLAGNFRLCSDIVGVLAWRYEHRIRRREDLLFSFGSERGPFPKDGPGHLGCRPSLSLAWRISLGCPWINNFRDLESVSTTLFLLLLYGLFVSFALKFCFRVHVSISTSTVFSAGLQEQSVQEELTPFPSSPTAFRLLSHTLTPIFTPR